MRKRMIVALAAALLVVSGGSAFAAGWDTWFETKDLAVFASVGYAWPNTSLAVYPGVEYTFATWKAGDEVPLAFGAEVSGIIDFFTGGVAFGVGPAATVRIGLKGLDLPEFLQRFDFCLGVGLAVMFGAEPPFGVFSHLGFDYFLSNKIAIVLEGIYFGQYGGAAAGVLFKL